MSTATAVACANLAFVKYWGKANEAINLPANGSISVNLSGAQTTTQVTFTPELDQDRILLGGQPANGRAYERVAHHLERVRALAGIASRAFVESNNNFPASAGIASSASGFAALSLAATRAAGLELSEKELSILARKGSGSACRSIPDGFVEWLAGDSDETSYAAQIAPPGHWDLRIVSALISTLSKEISSSEAHRVAWSSPFFSERLKQLPGTLDVVRRAIVERDFETFGLAVEREAVSMHAIVMTSRLPKRPWLSGVYYWQPATLALIQAVQHWRQRGLPVYFTIDAGPNVHLLCESGTLPELEAQLKALLAQWGGEYFVSEPAAGARLVD